MPDPLQALLAAGVVPTATFPPTSRYQGVGVAMWAPVPPTGEDPVPVAFLRRRLVPRPDRLAVQHEVTCVEGDRRDLLAATHLGDAELWWRIADGNGVIDPATMTLPVGRRLRITYAENVPGAGDG